MRDYRVTTQSGRVFRVVAENRAHAVARVRAAEDGVHPGKTLREERPARREEEFLIEESPAPLSGYALFESKVRGMGLRGDMHASAMRHGATLEECYGPSRLKHVVDARRDLIVLMRDRMGWSTTAIGGLFGRDPTTVLCYLRKHDAERLTEPAPPSAPQADPPSPEVMAAASDEGDGPAKF